MLGFFYPLLFWIFLLLIVVLVVAQVLLSRKKHHWRFGLILPSALLILTVLFLIIGISNDEALSYHTWGENIVTVLARFFLYNILTLVLLGIYGICRINRVGLKILLIALILSMISFPVSQNDGGTVVYCAVLYRITFLHRIDDTQTTGYLTGTTVYVFPFNFTHEWE